LKDGARPQGGVLATLLRRSIKTVFDGPDAKWQAAFSTAIEKAVTDPDYAKRIVSAAAEHKERELWSVRASARAMVATPVAVNAAPVNESFQE
jgi:hypothetical protein